VNFIYFEYLPAIVIGIIVFAVIVYVLEKKFFRLIKTYWFYERSIFSYVSSILLLLGMSGLLLALLDARGPEEKIKTEVPADRTIILMDTSASMLAEDVKPSRLQKAALMAKHFARKAAGHQIAVVAFAEIQKKIVPFTNDLDLIDSRLDSIKNLRNHYGSSALTVAIQESIQYFQEGQGELSGNILVLTDGEETAESLDLKVPKNIHIALVGIGTTRGGRIPLDDAQGFRFGYKKNRGQDIITKLNEDFFKKLTSEIPSAKYWIANSYSLPSDEVLNFFNAAKKKSLKQQDMVIRPVMMEWIVIPAIVLMIFSYLFKAVRVFSLGLLLIFSPLHSKEVDLSPELIQQMEDLQAGRLKKLEKIKLADDIYKAGLKEEALVLYEENLPLRSLDKNLPPEAYLNYGTALLEKGKTEQGLKTYENLLSSLEEAEEKESEIKRTIEKNIVTHFKQQEEKKKQQEKKNKDNKQNKDQNQDNQEGQQGDSGQSQGQQDKKEKSGKNPQDDKEKNSGENKKEDKEKSGNDNEDQNKEDQPKKQDGKTLPPKKMPAKLKQLMSDDRQLQMQMIENGTRDLNKRKSRTSKDW
jgi:Ca-activated chloride channel family protein